MPLPFFSCGYGYIHVALNLPQHHLYSHMSGSWLWGFRKDLKLLDLLGVVATYSPLSCRNDLVFENKHAYSPLQVVH
jgi:hypothetical protein